MAYFFKLLPYPCTQPLAMRSLMALDSAPTNKTRKKEQHMNDEKRKGKMGLALVGLGTYSEEELAPALQETEHCYLAGIVTG